MNKFTRLVIKLVVISSLSLLPAREVFLSFPVGGWVAAGSVFLSFLVFLLALEFLVEPVVDRIIGAVSDWAFRRF